LQVQAFLTALVAWGRTPDNGWASFFSGNELDRGVEGDDTDPAGHAPPSQGATAAATSDATSDASQMGGGWGASTGSGTGMVDDLPPILHAQRALQQAPDSNGHGCRHAGLEHEPRSRAIAASLATHGGGAEFGAHTSMRGTGYSAGHRTAVLAAQSSVEGPQAPSRAGERLVVECGSGVGAAAAGSSGSGSGAQAAAWCPRAGQGLGLRPRPGWTEVVQPNHRGPWRQENAGTVAAHAPAVLPTAAAAAACMFGSSGGLSGREALANGVL
jgi:hypothetical protein